MIVLICSWMLSRCHFARLFCDHLWYVNTIYYYYSVFLRECEDMVESNETNHKKRRITKRRDTLFLFNIYMFVCISHPIFVWLSFIDITFFSDTVFHLDFLLYTFFISESIYRSIFHLGLQSNPVFDDFILKKTVKFSICLI